MLTADAMIPSPISTFSEKRCSPRRRVLKGGFVSINERKSYFPCTVRDISTTGARLKVTNGFNIPAQFELLIELDGLEAHCEVVRRKIDEVGVRFVSAPRYVAPMRVQVIGTTTPGAAPSATLRRKQTSALS